MKKKNIITGIVCFLIGAFCANIVGAALRLYSQRQKALASGGKMPENGEDAKSQASEIAPLTRAELPSAKPDTASLAPKPVKKTGLSKKTSEPSLVNVNRANAKKLSALPGVGDMMAQKIMDYRRRSGGFASTEELKNVSGLGDKLYVKIENMITTGD